MGGQRALLVVWLWVGALGLAVAATGDARSAVIVLSSAALALGAWGFALDGGRTAITPVGVYCYAFGLFVGFAGLYMGLRSGWWEHEKLVPAIAIAYVIQVLTLGLVWRAAAPRATRAIPPVDARVNRWGFVVGAALISPAVVLALLGLNVPDVVPAVIFTGTVLVAVAMFHRRGGFGAWRAVVAAACFLLYFQFVFTGFGRLNLGALGLALAMAAATRWSPGAIKAGILAGSAPALAVLGQMRVDLIESLAPNRGGEVTGLGSVLTPLWNFAQLLEMSFKGDLPLRWGHSMWAALVSWVPRGLWPGKPSGFGAELVPLLRPNLVGTGHSEAALWHGEWIWNFGLVGLVALIPATAWLLRFLNGVQRAALRRGVGGHRDLMVVAAIIIATSGLPDLMWTGSFIYATRAGFRLIIVAAVVLAATRKAPDRSPTEAVRASDRRRSPARRGNSQVTY